MKHEKIMRLIYGLFWLSAGSFVGSAMLIGIAHCRGYGHEKETSADVWQPSESVKTFKWDSAVDSITNSEKDTAYFDIKDSTFYGNALLEIQYTSIAGTPNIEVMCYEWGYEEKGWIQTMPTLKTRSGILKTSHSVYGGRYKVVVSGRGTQVTKYRVTFAAERK